jgi:hypothetical protein
MNRTPSDVSRTIICIAALCTALLFTSANAGEQAASGDPAGDAQEAAVEDSTGAWDKTREVSSEAWEATKEGSAKAWDKTREASSEAWEATKEGSARAWDKTKEVTHETMEKISPSESADTQEQDMQSTAPAAPDESR